MVRRARSRSPPSRSPSLLLDLVLLTLGVALFLAPLHVRYHDVGYLWGIALQIGFWLTPIIYQEVMIPQRWQLAHDLQPDGAHHPLQPPVA